MKRLVDSDHATLTLARRLQSRSPHAEGFQIFNIQDDDQDDGGNQGHISDVSASQAERDGTETAPATRAPPPLAEEQQASIAPPTSGSNVENVVLVEPQSQVAAEGVQTTATEGQQQEGTTETATEEEEDHEETAEDTQIAIARSLGAALPTRGRDDDDDDDDDDSLPEQKFKCTVPGCDKKFSEHHELKGTSPDLGTRYLYSNFIPQRTFTSTTINLTDARLEGVKGHIPLKSRGTGMCPFIVSR